MTGEEQKLFDELQVEIDELRNLLALRDRSAAMTKVGYYCYLFVLVIVSFMYQRCADSKNLDLLMISSRIH